MVKTRALPASAAEEGDGGARRRDPPEHLDLPRAGPWPEEVPGTPHQGDGGCLSPLASRTTEVSPTLERLEARTELWGGGRGGER